MFRSVQLAGLFFVLLLSGCDQASLIKKMTPVEDEAIAKNYINLLREKKFEEIEPKMDSSIKGPNLHEMLEKMASVFPDGEPKSVKVVGVYFSNFNGSSGINISFEYEFEREWLVVNVATQKKDGVSTIVGFNVYPTPDSLENLNRFTLVGKSAIHYIVLTFAVLIPLFSLCVLVLCIRTKIEKRKWLWIIAILLGVGTFAVDWTTGQWRFAPLSFLLLGASAFAPLYGAWTISVAFPLGAIVFLLRRKKLGGANLIK